MNNRNSLLLIVIISLTSCNNSVTLKQEENGNNQRITSTDSIELTSLVRKLYKWHLTQKYTSNFPFKYNNPGDSIFTGIDWDAYSKNIETLKETHFFAKEFFTNHLAIALRIDSSIKQAKPEWRNINDGITLWDTDADDWCGCQDYPDNYWKTITLNTFCVKHDTLAFNWTWGNENGFQANKYELNAKKENGAWRISNMEGFDYYGTVADYNKEMTK